jgi:hypothetical protein
MSDEQIETVEGQVEEQGRELATTDRKTKAQLAVGEKGYIVPNTVEEAVRMAQAVVVAGLAPSSYDNNPNKILLGIMAAMEAGLQPLYGLRQIAIINGRPTIWGDAAMALVQSKNLIDEYSERQVGPEPDSSDLTKWPDDYGWEVTIRRRGQKGEYVGRYTVGMAKRAKLWLNGSKQPWMQHPDRMLKIRARAFPLRDGFADALAGLAIREEVEDYATEDKHVAIDLDDKPKVEAPPMEDV